MFLGRGMISPEDLSLYRVTDWAEEAMDEIVLLLPGLPRHALCRQHLVLQLQHPPTPPLFDRIRGEARHPGRRDVEVTGAVPERQTTRCSSFCPVRFRFDRRSLGRLRQLIDLINGEG